VIRIRVTSTSLVSIGYDPETKTLELEFVAGTVYQYFDVPQSVYEALMAADSKGTFVSDHVKGQFFFNRIES
jgi:hypothetical protein